MKIIAVGNSFYGDDGVAVAVLERIRSEQLFPEAELVDVGTDALALLDHLEADGWNVVIDAARMDLEPGAVCAFGPGEVRLRIQSDHLSMHGFGLAETFDLARQLEILPSRLLIVGVEPELIEINRGLSAAVAAAVPEVVKTIQAEVQADG